MIQSASVLGVAWLLTLFTVAGGDAGGKWMLMGAVVKPQVVVEGAASPTGQGAASPTGQDAAPIADVVIRNARVVTIDRDNPRAQAIAFRGETIIAVTTDEFVEKYMKEGVTQVIDARGRLVVPGFNDAHIHFGPVDPDYIDLRYIRDPAVITQRVKEAVARAKPGELIRGGLWEHEMFYGKQWPTKGLLDPVAPNNPVVLTRADGHSVLVNSYVIRHSRITKETPDPAGGEIQRDPATGEPTGIFKEQACELLKYGDKPVRRSAREKQEQLKREWQAAFDLAARTGVTSIQLAPDGDLAMYQKFADMGRLTVRVSIGGWLTGNKTKLNSYRRLLEKYPRDGNWIRFGYLKTCIDGTLGSGTALFFKPYVDVPDATGLSQMSYAELERLVVTADKAGFQIGIHAIGDVVIYDRDLLTIPHDQIMSAKVDYTIVGGKVVYHRNGID